MSNLHPIRFDKYILLDRIAIGGMAEVYRAKLTGEEGFEKPVVLKKMLPHLSDEIEMTNHFIDEAKLAAQLKHENIIHIYDFGSVENTFFIVMEYLFGKDLNLMLKQSTEINQNIDLENILFIISKICEGLGYAHQLKNLQGSPLNIIHRDISPHNIFITYEGQIKLIDFGIAKATSNATKTQTGIIKGKVAYMSPEQAEGKPIDYRSDIFSVGIILYELVTGKKMFDGDTFEALQKIIQNDYEPPESLKPNLPDTLYKIINKSLQKNPDDRYATCEEMGSDIEDCIHELSYRPSSKKLSDYTQLLFEGQFDIEKQQLAEIMSPKLTVSTSTFKIETSPDYQPTEALKIRTPTEVHSKFKKYGNMLVNKVITHKTNKKVIIFSAVAIFFVLALGIPLSNQIKQYNENSIKIEKLLKTAENRLTDKQITYPEKDCAYHYYQEVLKIDPGNKRAKKGLEEISSYCILMAKKEINKLNLPSARHYIEIGMFIDSENEELIKLKSKTSDGKNFYIDGIKNIFKEGVGNGFYHHADPK